MQKCSRVEHATIRMGKGEREIANCEGRTRRRDNISKCKSRPATLRAKQNVSI